MKLISKFITCFSFLLIIGCSEASSVEEKGTIGIQSVVKETVKEPIKTKLVEGVMVEEFRMNKDFICDYPKLKITDIGNNKYQFTGQFEVPSTGYSYSLSSNGKDEFGIWDLELSLISPMRAAGMVISKIEINDVLEVEAEELDKININIKKRFKWGVDKISCVIPYE